MELADVIGLRDLTELVATPDPSGPCSIALIPRFQLMMGFRVSKMLAIGKSC